MPKSGDEIREDFARKKRQRSADESAANNGTGASQRPRRAASRSSAWSGERPDLKRAPTGRQTDIHRTPPHSVEAEMGVIGSMIKSPRDTIAEVVGQASPTWFFVPAHVTIYNALVKMWDSRQAIDLVTFTQHLRDVGQLDAVGGPFYVTELFTFVPTAANIQYYLEIVRDKYVARETQALSMLLAKNVASATEDELWSVISEHERAITALRGLATETMQGVENFVYQDLLHFNPREDETVLLGSNRWLGRGYTCLWAGGSGYGKSTLEMQAALYWATGTPLFGIATPRGPLKSLIIQAENDLGDTAEQFQGVVAGIEKTGDIKLNSDVERMVVVVRLVGCSGDTFIARLKSLLKIHRPDLVWIDPLFAFAGCDLIDTPAISHFIRNQLIPVAIEHKCCAHVIHHIGKPARDNDAKKNWSSFDYQFLGFGSSEIQNAFRAVNVLIPVSGDEGVFRLVLSKRGERSGAKDIEGNLTTSLYLSHAKGGDGILWSQVDKPDEPQKQKRREGQFIKEFNLADLLGQMSVVHGMKTNALLKHTCDETGMSRATFYRFFDQAKSEGKIRLSEDGWIIKNKDQN